MLAILMVAGPFALPLVLSSTPVFFVRALRVSIILTIMVSAGVGMTALRRGRFRLSVSVASLGMILALCGNLATTGLRGAGPLLLGLSVPLALAGMLAGRG